MRMKLKYLLPFIPYALESYFEFEGQNFLRPVNVNNVMAFVDGDTSAKIMLWDINELILPKVKPWGYLTVESLKIDLRSGMIPQKYWNELVKAQYDVFGLIAEGLAVDFNLIEL